MKIDDVEKLLGGYATGTLTPLERKALFDAALDNQALFDALAGEEELRQLLADPATRAELLALLREDPAPVKLAAAASPAQAGRSPSLWHRLGQWLFRPMPMTAIATVAVAVVAIVLMKGPSAREAREIAMAPPPVQQPQLFEPKAQPVKSADAPARSDKPPAPAPPPAAVDQVASERRTQAPVVADTILKKKDEDAKSAAQQSVAQQAKETGQRPEQPQSLAQSQAPGLSQSQAPLEAQRPANMAAPPSPSRLAPFRYVVERREPNGNWVEFGGDLATGDEARIRITAQQEGFITFSTSSGASQTIAAREGQTHLFPATGALPSGAGERTVRISYAKGSPESAFGGAASGRAMLRDARKKTEPAAPAPAAKGEIGRESDTREVIVRLRYR